MKIILTFLVYSVIAKRVLEQQRSLCVLNFPSCYLQNLLQTKANEDSQRKAFHPGLTR